MEQFYGVLISVLLSLLIISLGIIGRMIMVAQRRQLERSDKHHDDIIRLQGGYKGIFNDAEELKTSHNTLNKEVRVIDKRVTALEK